MASNHKLLSLFIFLLIQNALMAKDYFVHPNLGNDTNSGYSKERAIKTLERASKINFLPGDRLFLASGQSYTNTIKLIDIQGTEINPIIITTISWENDTIIPALIDFKGKPYGVLIQDCSFIHISNIKLTANGYFLETEKESKMRCGILITNKNSKLMRNIMISNVTIYDVYYENYGFKRSQEEVKTANGTQKYGWGIRITNDNADNSIRDIDIKRCNISSISHTGIKLTGNSKNILNVKLKDNIIEKTGGPGIQMSEVKSVYVTKNLISHSGSTDDTRKWGRGSGLWTWGSTDVLIEKNKFLYANGPGDSAGAHIDFNCDNIVLQYNISAYNAGGFCEILGNNYNCCYRYNISINDGHRTKGVDGAFQEGKIFWLSGYQGEKKERKGPVNTYFYNNTIFSDSAIISKIAIDNTSNGILIANNIFYLKGNSKSVLGDQYKPDEESKKIAENVFFKNNLFLHKDNWPNDIGIKDIAPVFGDPIFTNEGGIDATDYIPLNLNLIKNKGIEIGLLPNDKIGFLQSFKLEKDILGNVINKTPSIGAIEPIQ